MTPPTPKSGAEAVTDLVGSEPIAERTTKPTPQRVFTAAQVALDAAECREIVGEAELLWVRAILYDCAVRDLETGFMEGAYARLKHLQNAETELFRLKSNSILGHNSEPPATSEKRSYQDLESAFDRQSTELAHSQSCLGNLEMAHLELIGERDELDKALLIANLKCNEYGVRMDKAEAELAQWKSLAEGSADLVEGANLELLRLSAELDQAKEDRDELMGAIRDLSTSRGRLRFGIQAMIRSEAILKRANASAALIALRAERGQAGMGGTETKEGGESQPKS